MANDGQVIDFFAAFSRFECALKRSGFVKGDRYRNANADWEKFAAQVLDARLEKEISPAFTKAKDYLMQKPPNKQVVKPHHKDGMAEESEGRHFYEWHEEIEWENGNGPWYQTWVVIRGEYSL